MPGLPIKSITIGSDKYIISGSGSVDSSSEPTEDTVAEFDSSAHMNSTDMTTGADSELEDFIDGLNVSGGSNFVEAVEDCFVVREFSSSSGASYGAFVSGNKSVSITSPTGYTPFMVVGTRTNGDVWLSYPSAYILNSETTSVTVWIRNCGNASASITSVTVAVLFVKEK